MHVVSSLKSEFSNTNNQGANGYREEGSGTGLEKRGLPVKDKPMELIETGIEVSQNRVAGA